MNNESHKNIIPWLIICGIFFLIAGLWYVLVGYKSLGGGSLPAMPRFINTQPASPLGGPTSPAPDPVQAPTTPAQPDKSATDTALTSQGTSILSVFFVLFFFGFIYFLLYQNWIDRTILFVLGAIGIVVLGKEVGFYDWAMAGEALKSKLDVICFLVGMNIITVILAQGGLFEYLAKRITLATRGNKWKIMLWFCLLTFGLSLLINNLTTMLVLIPMILTLSRYLRFNPAPYLVGMVIASNLGGASTMVGDFPNMLIATQSGMPFIKFVVYLMPICLVQLVILVIYMRVSQRQLFARGLKPKAQRMISSIFDELPQLKPAFATASYHNVTVAASDINTLDSVSGLQQGTGNHSGSSGRAIDTGSGFFKKMEGDLKTSIKDARVVKRALFILGILLIGFLVSDLVHVPPAIMALIGGGLALFLSGLKPIKVLENLAYKDIFFFAGLFILVGAAEASGLLGWLTEIVMHLSFGSILVRCLLLMWLAAVVTAFLNAGPATALFLPLVLSFNTVAPHYLYWWSLSLGVLAGSSATLTGATAGTIASSMLKEFAAGKSYDLSFKSYARLGVPIAIMFLVVSSIYITLIYKYV